ncbi:MAG TPA: ABC transporter permease [Ktedonobacteraceae bacterium]|nr:ABC transporter permease [Ktedonobacteraceae bacterium]
MIQFLVKRFIGLIFVLIGVTFITFILGYFAPGDPIRDMLGEHFNLVVYNQLRHAYGLDLPWYQQYFNFLSHMFRFDFGFSYKYTNRAVMDILKDGVPVSAELGFWALILQMLVGVPVGIFSALKANTWIDTVNMGFILILYSIPVFVLAVVMQVVIIWFDQKTGASWPVSNWGTPWAYDPADLSYKVIPILVFAAGGMAYIARLSRASMLEVLKQDFVRTARAKGLLERVVIYKHALRNAMIPLLTVFGLLLALLVSGAFFIENIFNIPGIGYETVQSISDRDYPVIQATVVLFAVAVVIGNMLSDILYSLVDPRIKAQ